MNNSLRYWGSVTVLGVGQANAPLAPLSVQTLQGVEYQGQGHRVIVHFIQKNHSEPLCKSQSTKVHLSFHHAPPAAS